MLCGEIVVNVGGVQNSRCVYLLVAMTLKRTVRVEKHWNLIQSHPSRVPYNHSHGYWIVWRRVVRAARKRKEKNFSNKGSSESVPRPTFLTRIYEVMTEALKIICTMGYP